MRYQLVFFNSQRDAEEFYRRNTGKGTGILGPIISYPNAIGLGDEILLTLSFRDGNFIPEQAGNHNKFVVCRVIHVLNDKLDETVAELFLVPKE